jgi:CO dehydrogenase/acetyl-CoA synthase delta subunit
MNAPKIVRWSDVSDMADRILGKLEDLAAEDPGDYQLAVIVERFAAMCVTIHQRAAEQSLNDLAAALGRTR